VTTIYLSYNGPVAPVLARWDWTSLPLSILVALPYLRNYQRDADLGAYRPRRRMLDSGAFSVWKSGRTIDIDELVRESMTGGWDESVGLDVIGSATGTRRNMDYMLEKGSPAMPVFHIGDPWELLAYYCERWPKVGLGAMVGAPARVRDRFVEQCFARAWPHRFHAFGCTQPAVLGAYPFHSADSSSWQQAPMAFRVVRIAGSRPFRARGVPVPTVQGVLEHSIRHYIDLELRLASAWARELALLESQ
jgi:hypothetical protein